jgi:hypothetical protein
MPKKYSYIGCCVDLPGERISDMVDRARDITYRTFMGHVDRERVATLFSYYDWPGRPQESGLTLKRDWHVSYHKSHYRGLPCYFLQHSGIEYVFVAPKEAA